MLEVGISLVVQVRLVMMDELNEIVTPALEIPSSVFDDGHEITALIDENVIAAGFEPETAAS